MNIDFYWGGDPRWNPYFILSSGVIVGFLVVLFENLDTDPDPTHVIYDFMILKKYRRSGLGRTAAKQAFGLFKANWKVAQMESNTSAISLRIQYKVVTFCFHAVGTSILRSLYLS